jgi:hypothetical protein
LLTTLEFFLVSTVFEEITEEFFGEISQIELTTFGMFRMFETRPSEEWAFGDIPIGVEEGFFFFSLTLALREIGGDAAANDRCFLNIADGFCLRMPSSDALWACLPLIKEEVVWRVMGF